MGAKLFLVLFAFLFAVPHTGDLLIDWNASRKLSWSDFIGKPDPASPNAALTSTTVNVQFGYDKNGLKHSITCRFDPAKSWVRTKNAYILNHEQGHFDLAEAYARKLHKELLEYVFNKETVGGDLNKIYGKVMQEHIHAQDQYDTQTNHSLDSARQKEWSGKINAMLKELEPFKDYTDTTLKQPVKR